METSPKPKPRLEFFATCAPGLEPILHEEIKGLRFAHVERQVGGVRFEGTMRDAWRANLELRTAVRVLQKVRRFEARDADQLYSGVQEVDWSTFLRPGGSLRVDAHSNESELGHTLFVEQKTKDAVCDQLREKHGDRPSVDLEDADLGIYVHLFRDRCTVLTDTSGDSLHKRGWRRHQGRAPLAETLGAAIVLASGWDRRSPLLDPFCGSGTILIEAALIAGNVAPGIFRRGFGFERWPGHDEASWRALHAETKRRAAFTSKLVMKGSDADRAIVAEATENAASAGLEGRLVFECARAEDFAPKRGWNAWIVSNPPYGERIGDERALEPLFMRFGSILRDKCAGYRASILSGNPKLTHALGLTPKSKIALKNGSIECELLQYEL